MKKYKWIVYFTGGGEETVSAVCMEDAEILAKAKRINKGLEYHLVRIEQKETAK